MDCDETIRISSSCFSDDDTATLKKLLNEFEQYMELLPYVRKNPNLEGNIAARLYNKITRTDQYIAFGKHNTIIITTRCAHSVLDYAKIKDGVTVTCNDRLPRPAYRPDDGWGLVTTNHAICYVLTLNSKSLTTCQLTLKNSHKSLITLESV